VFLDRPWTVDNGDLSQTLKLRRRYLVEKYRDVIESLYS
jgi:long-subunit acyl-CoA synthetase (AMP-forming)